MSHLSNLLVTFPNLLSGSILDIGAGGGEFLIDVEKKGGKIVGIELKTENIKAAKLNAAKSGIHLNLIQGKAEALPIANSSIDFVNLCEVIEHVEDPVQVLSEVHRVLKPSGQGYISVPNRYGFKDQHFHLYFINWIPRKYTYTFITLFGKHKNYDGSSGYQRLDQMHYYTYKEISNLLTKIGFQVEDIRKNKILKKYNKLSYLLLPVYYILRQVYLDSFHLAIIKIR